MKDAYAGENGRRNGRISIWAACPTTFGCIFSGVLQQKLSSQLDQWTSSHVDNPYSAVKKGERAESIYIYIGSLDALRNHIPQSFDQKPHLGGFLISHERIFLEPTLGLQPNSANFRTFLVHF